MESEDSMPQPLSKVKPNVDVRVRASGLNPELCAYVTRTITAWAYTDHIFAKILTGQVRGDFVTVSSMFQALTSGQAKMAALYAAIGAAKPENLPLAQATIRSTKPSRDERNIFAHHIIAIADDVPDSLIMIEPSSLIDPDALFRDMVAKGEWKPKVTPVGNVNRIELPAIPVPDQSKMLVYRRKDLKDAAENAETCTQVIIELMKAISLNHPDEQARQRLLQEPRIQRGLERLSRGNAQEPPPQQPETPAETSAEKI